MTLRIRLALALFAMILTGMAPAQMPIDAYDPDVNSTVNTISRGHGGSLLIGGGFSAVGGQSRGRLALLRPDGRPDTVFLPSLGGGGVLDSMMGSDGHFVVVGSFTTGGNRIARVHGFFGNPVSNLAAVAPNGIIRAVAEASEPDPVSGLHGLYLGGDFSSIGGQTRTRVARVHHNGSLDTGFVPPAYSGTVHALAVQDDGKLLVGGTIGPEGEVGGRRIYRLNTDGSQDPGFTAPAVLATGNHSVRAIALDLGGRILIAGANGSAGFVMRLNPNGSLDPTFTAPSLNGPVLSLALQPDGRLVIGGDFTNASLRGRLARLNDDGSVDGSFVPLMNPNGAVNALEVRPGGEVIFAGAFTNINGTIPRNRIAAVNRHGRLDQALNVIPNDRIWAMVPDGNSLLLAGDFSEINGQARPTLARVFLDGTVSPSFQPVIEGGEVEAVSVQPDGRILIVGRFNRVNGQIRQGVARLHPDGSLDTSFAHVQLRIDPQNSGDPFFRGAGYFLRLLQDGRILIGGSFDRIGEVPRRGLARVHPDGSLDASFVPDSSIAWDGIFSWPLTGALIHPEGGYLVHGQLYRQGATPELRLLRVQEDGSLHPSFNTDFATDRATPLVDDLLVFDDRILAAGSGIQPSGGFGWQSRWPSSGSARNCVQGAWLTLDGVFEECASWQRQDGRFWAGATGLAGGLSMLGTAEWDSEPNSGIAGSALVVGIYDEPDDNQSLLTLAHLDNGNNLYRGARLQLTVLEEGRVLMYDRGDFNNHVNNQEVAPHAPIRIRHDRFVDPEPVWDTSNHRVSWQYGGGSILRRTGAALAYPPRVLVSNSCCNPNNFQPPAGGGQMVWSESDQRWVLDGFQGLPGVFYLMIQAQAEDSRGNSWPIRTPIHRYEGTLPLPPAQADLEMKLVANVAEAEPGQVVEFSVQVSNRGPNAASDPEAFITLPGGYQLIDFAADNGFFDPDQGYWKLDDLAVGGAAASAELTLQVQVLAQGGHVLSATVDSSTFDPNYNNNQRSLEIDILLARSDLALSMVPDESLVLPGELAYFDVQVTNNGPEPASAVTVSSAIPTGYTWQGDNSGGSFNPATGQWQVGHLAVGASASLKLALQVNPDGGYLMIGQVSSNSLDPEPNNNIAVATVDPFTDLAVSLSADPPQAMLGDTVVIHVDFHNLGPADATATQVQVAVPDSFLTTGHVSEVGAYEPANGIWDIGPSKPGSHRLSIVGAITISNPQIATATVSSETFDTVPGNNQASITIELLVAPELQITPGSVNFGQQAVGEASSARTVSLRNTGQASLNLTSISLSGAHEADFSLSDDCGSSLAPDASCALEVVFTPGAVGTRNATVQIVSNAPSSPHSLSLSGAGIAGQPGDDVIFRDRFQQLPQPQLGHQ
ncbi:MAG: choice-of-anchor D domain-containing protein [Wenzhouxiangella sp.]